MSLMARAGYAHKAAQLQVLEGLGQFYAAMTSCCPSGKGERKETESNLTDVTLDAGKRQGPE
jgi:hypothetical protein